MSKTAVVFIAGVLVLAGASAFAFQAEPPEPGPIDVEAVTAEPVPFEAPDDGVRRVLVAEVEIFTEGDRPFGEVVSTEEIDSYAPKVFVRAGGDWLVRLDADPVREFFVLDPRFAETETEDGDGLTWIQRPEPVLWTLVIPLYADGEPLEFNTATVIDLATEIEIITIQR